MFHSEEFSGNLKNPNTKDYKLAAKLTAEEVEAWNMYMNNQSGILPTQYHWSYEQGDTIIYPEHVADLFTLEKMWSNRKKYREGKARQEQEAKALQEKLKSGQNVTTLNQGGASAFYGKKYRYTK